MKTGAVVVAAMLFAVGGSALGVAVAEEKPANLAAPASPATSANPGTTAVLPPPLTPSSARTPPGNSPATPTATPPGTPPGTPPAQAPTRLSQAQLDQLLAPVALYPDQLLDQVLMASTYPLEIVEAARWVKVPAHRRLRGKELMAAVQGRNWAPSVMALLPFPDLLKTMNEKIGWTEELGNAFLAQEADVIASIQGLRRAALTAGNLETAKCRCTVEQHGDIIAIAPVNRTAVDVPLCNPMVAYGRWPYPSYPPVVFPVPVGFVWAPVPFIAFYPPVMVAFYDPFWGWADFDWGRRDIIVNAAAYSLLSFGHPGFSGSVWQHEPAHRRGVAYADAAVAARFGGRAATAGRANFRAAGLSGGAVRSGALRGSALRGSGAHAAALRGGFHGRGGGYRASAGGWHHGGGFAGRYHGGGFRAGHAGFAMRGGFHGGHGGGFGGGFHGGGFHGGGFHGSGFAGGHGGGGGGHGGGGGGHH